VLVRTGVIDIGLKSALVAGFGILGMGRIVAHFHCIGTTAVSTKKFEDMGDCFCQEGSGYTQEPCRQSL